jgi:hypothetical protein
MEFNELKNRLKEAIDNWDKETYRKTLLESDNESFLAALTEDDRRTVKSWITRERAMMEIESGPLRTILLDQTIVFDRATEEDPDFSYPPQRGHAYTVNLEDYNIARNNIQDLRTISYDEFIENYFGSKENL